MAILFEIRSSARNTSVWIDTVICVSILQSHGICTSRILYIHVDCACMGIYSCMFLTPLLNEEPGGDCQYYDTGIKES